MFKSFDIENEKICCTDASALQSLIPFVKRLLQLFPRVKENTKRSLSSDEAGNRVYQFETRRYIERISQSPTEFNSDASSFREFLESEQKKVLHLQVVKGVNGQGKSKYSRYLK
jgi:hypothetical protein